MKHLTDRQGKCKYVYCRKKYPLKERSPDGIRTVMMIRRNRRKHGSFPVSWTKDPQIRNTGKNGAYVYMEVSDIMADVIYTDALGQRPMMEKCPVLSCLNLTAEIKSARH